MVGWYHQLDRHEFEQALGAGDGQGSWCAAVHAVAKGWTQLSDKEFMLLNCGVGEDF